MSDIPSRCSLANTLMCVVTDVCPLCQAEGWQLLNADLLQSLLRKG